MNDNPTPGWGAPGKTSGRFSTAVICLLVLGAVAAMLLLAALVARIFFYQPFNIPSGSSYPNLVIGDYVLVSKTAYGRSQPPQRGDIAVFKLPRDPKIDYIKRVVGLPGDRIQMQDGVLYINGAPVKLERIEDYVDNSPDGEGGGQPIPQYVETLPNGVSYRILSETPNGGADTTQEYEVPAGHYFTLGDNRDNSEDSRYLDQVGYIPEENFIGPVVWLFWNSMGVPISGRP